MSERALPGRPTIIDVARVAGVSKSTVSRVLQGEETSVRPEKREMVWRAVAELGYERNAVASGLRTDRTYMVMLVVPDISNPFWPEEARGMQDRLLQQGYSVVLGNSDWKHDQELLLLQTARRNRFDGIAINPALIHEDELRSAGIPAVILGIHEAFPGFDMAGSDSYGGTVGALEYLYGLGHRRIGFIRGRHSSPRRQARSRGYADFLARHGLPLDHTLLVEVAFDRAGGAQAMRALLEAPRPPTAVFAANDILAIGAMEAARASGLRIPGDLSIVGMDDIYPASMTTPGLTTMAKPKYETGVQAAELLLERMRGEGPDERRRCTLPCTLVERGSAAPPGAHERREQC